jgi:hypothetical protein
MATDEFLSCLSRQALEREARANTVRVEARVKDSRARMITHFTGTTWHYPDALFKLSQSETKELGSDTEDGHPGANDELEAGAGNEEQDRGDSLDHDSLADAAD